MAIKRVFDIAASLLGLLILSPVLLATGLIVLLDSGRPVLFRQERVGLNGEVFNIRKFRTMRSDSPGPGVSASDDARITRSGRWLRRVKLDELPQLVDVLVGKMSIVGPRPELPKYVAEWPRSVADTVLSVRPGITDPVSIALRDEGAILSEAEDPERFYVEEMLLWKAQRYVDYVESRSFLGDIRIILQTVCSIGR